MIRILYFCNQKTSYDMRISDWISDVCSSDLLPQTSRSAKARASSNGAYDAPQQLRNLPCLDHPCCMPSPCAPLCGWRHPQQRRKLYRAMRSEEHTSELQPLMRRSYAVFCLKQKKKNKRQHTSHYYATRMPSSTS